MAETGNIKTFESPIDRLTPTNIGAEAEEMAGRHIAATYHQAGESIGSGISSLGQQIEQHDTVMQTADLMKKMSDLEVQKQQALINAKKTMDINDPDAVNKFMDNFQDQTDDITSKTYTPRAYDTMTRMMSDFNARTKNDFLGYQSNAQANQAMANFENAGNNYGTILGLDPSQANNVKAQIQLGAQNLQVEHRATLTLPVIQHALDTGAETMVGRVEGQKKYDPKAVQQTIDYIDDPKNGYIADPKDPNSVGMSQAKYTEVMNRLNNQKHMGANQTIAGATLNAGAMEKQIGQTGIVPPAYTAMTDNLRAIGTPEAVAKANELDQNSQNQQGAYHVGQIVNNVPSSELSGVADQVKNASKNPNLSASQIAVLQAGAEKVEPLLKARNEAFYGGNPVKQGQWNIDTNPSIQNAYDAWRKNPTPRSLSGIL